MGEGETEGGTTVAVGRAPAEARQVKECSEGVN